MASRERPHPVPLPAHLAAQHQAVLGRLVVDGIATGRFEIQIEDVPQTVAVARAQDAGVFAELAFEVPLREPRPQEMAEPQRFGVRRPRPACKWGSDARVPEDGVRAGLLPFNCSI